MQFSIPTETKPEDLDSATVLRQLHSDVSNFEAQLSDMNGIHDRPLQASSSSSGMNVDNFDSVASKLEEAMAVITE